MKTQRILWTKVTEGHYDAHTEKFKIFLGSIQNSAAKSICFTNEKRKHKDKWHLLKMIYIIKSDKDIDKLKEYAKTHLIDNTRNYGKTEKRTKKVKEA